MSEMFTVGTIVGPHGLKGEVKVFSRTDYPELRFAPGSRLLVFRQGQDKSEELVIKSSRIHKSLYLVLFEGFESVELVEKMRGAELKVLRSDAPPLPEGEYWIDDLINCQVVAESGEVLGQITDVLTPGANDVYVVRKPGRKDILIPAIPQCVLNVDVENKRMLIHLMPGLIDEV